MFNLGAGEVLAIAVIALIVLGPEKIPSAMRQLGRFTGELRRMSSGFQAELRDALADEDDERDAIRSARPVAPPEPEKPTAEPPGTDEPSAEPPGADEPSAEPPGADEPSG